MAVRLPLVALLLGLLAAPLRAQEPPPARAAWWSEVGAWQQLAERWASTPDALVRAALARLAWEAVDADPAARALCVRARAADAGRLSPAAARLLEAMAGAGPPPPIVPWAPGAPIAGPPAERLEGEGLLAETRRVLALGAALDVEDGEARRTEWLAAGALPADALTGLSGVPAARTRLAALSAALPALGWPGPDAVHVAPARRSPGWLVASGPRVWVVEDEAGERSVVGPDCERVSLVDRAVGRLLQRSRGARARAARLDEGHAFALGALAHDADASGRGWLAQALVATADAEVGRSWHLQLIDRWAQRRLSEAGRRYRQRASDAEVQALLAPARAHGSSRLRAEAEELAAALAPPRPAPGPSPAWAEWEASGLGERLEQLGRALAWAELDDPFPEDAPLGPDGRRQTVGGQLAALGWSGLPLRLARADDPRLLRAPGPGPGGLARMADAALDAPYLPGPGRPEPLERRAARARAWWEPAREAGAGAWWQAHLLEVLDRRPGWLEGLVRDLGQGATPRLLALLADPAPTAGRGRADVRRARCLRAAVELEDGDFAPAFLAAREAADLQLALSGAAGLARLEARYAPPDGPRPELERLRSTARWLGADRRFAAVEALLLLEPLDPALAGELTLALAAQLSSPFTLAVACGAGETLDRRLALCRLVVALEALDEVPGGLLEALVAWRVRARRGPSPPGEVLELLAPFALELLVEDAPRWRDDPTRRDHAVTTAALLGPEVADALSLRVGLDVRALVATRLVQPDRAAAAAARAELAGCPHLRGWLGHEGPEGPSPLRARALSALDGPDPGPRLRLGRVEARSELPPALLARAQALSGREVTAGDLVDLLGAWAEGPAGPPALRLELHHAAWSPPTLELSTTSPAEGPGCVVEARAGARVLVRQTADGAPTRVAEQPLRAALQALSERGATGAHATLVATR